MNTLKRTFNLKAWFIVSLIMMVTLVTACETTKKDSSIGIGTEVTSIVIASAADATTITTLGGTLQMYATVTPVTATDLTYTWSVVNGTGSATISPAGLLAALSDGTVTVRATSNKTTSISASKVITLSNQLVLNMDNTLTDLTVDGVTVLGFNPLVTNYVQVVSSGVTASPTVAAVKYDATAIVNITNATNITSENIIDRTTVVVVTSSSDVQKTYSVVFESSIAPVELGIAGDFVVLAETGISTATTSNITGDLGVSPSAATYITGFSLIMDSTGTFSTSSQVVGNIYSADYTTPTPSKLTTAIADIMIAYTDAAGRAANYTELYSGDLSGKTLTPGVFKFGSSVLINTELTLSGSATDVWIFQISGNLTMASDIQITLAGGADAKNIVWQVADTVAIGSGSHFEGTVLAMTNISMGTNSSMNGRIYAQTAVTLDATIVVKSND